MKPAFLERIKDVQSRKAPDEEIKQELTSNQPLKTLSIKDIKQEILSYVNSKKEEPLVESITSSQI